MTKEIGDINTDTREEMVCPHCWTKGLEESSLAEQCEDNQAQKIIYATSCPNTGCPNHDSGTGDPCRVDPDEIKEQYSSTLGNGILSSLSGLLSGFSKPHISGSFSDLLPGLSKSNILGSVSSLLSDFSTSQIVGALAIVVLVASFGAMGGLSLIGDSGPVDTSSPPDNVNETDSTSSEYPHEFEGVSGKFKVVAQNGDWRIFGSGGNTYVIADTNESNRQFVTASGRVTSSATLITGFDTAQHALKSLLGGSEFEQLSAPSDGIQLLNDSYHPVATKGNWVVYRTGNGDYVVGGMFDGAAKFITTTGGLSYTPSYFSSQDAAENALADWRTANSNGPEASPGDNPTSYSDWQIFSHEGGYIVAAADGDYTVYLYPDGSISTEPYTYKTADGATRAIFNYELVDANLTASEYDAQYQYDISSETTVKQLKYDLTSATQSDFDLGGSDDSGYYGSGGDSWECNNCGDDSTSETLAGSENEGSRSNTSINGRVTNSSGVPVENTTVHLYSKHYTTTTDADGYYEFTNVPTGIHEIHVEPPEQSGMAATANTTINVTEGGMRVVNETDSVQYFEYQDKVAENRLNFHPSQMRPIQGSGSGSSIATKINFDNPRNAENVSLTLAPAYSGATRTLNQQGSSASDTLTIQSEKPPTGQILKLSGLVTREPVSVEKKDSSSLLIEGNYPATSPLIEIEGNEKTTTRQVDGSSTTAIQNNGNLNGTASVTIEGGPETTTNRLINSTGETNLANNGNIDTSATVTVAGGDETTNQRTVSGTGTTAITNNGNVEREVDLTINGDTNYVARSKTGSLSDGDTITVDVKGSEPAKNVQIELTGKEGLNKVASGGVGGFEGYYTHDQEARGGSSSGDNIEHGPTYRVDYNVDVKVHRMELKYSNGRCPGFTIDHASQSFWDGALYFERQCGSFSDSGSFEFSADDDYPKPDEIFMSFKFTGMEGSHHSIGGYVDWNGGYDVYRYTSPRTTSVDVDGSTEATTELDTGQKKTLSLGTLEPGTHQITLDTENAPADYQVSWDETRKVDDLSIDTDNDGTAEYTRSTPLGDGETATTTATLSPGKTEITVNNNGPTPTWSGSFTELTATADISADLNGDGETDFTQSGPLRESESVTKTVTLEPGTNGVSIQNTGPSPAVNASYTEVTATKGLSADLDGDGVADITHSGALREGDTVTQTVPMEPGEHQVTVNSKGPEPTWSGQVTENYATEDPTIQISDTATVSEAGLLRDGETETVTLSQLESGQQTVEMSTTAGPTPSYNLSYVAQAVPEDVTVTVNGDEYRYPEDFDSEGKLSTYSETSVSSLNNGENTVNVDVSDVNGVTPRVQHTIEYESYANQSADPEIILLTPSGKVYTRTVPDSALSNGKLNKETTITFPQRLFESGEHTVVVRTPDSTIIQAGVSATGADYQGASFQPSSNMNVSTQLP